MDTTHTLSPYATPEDSRQLAAERHPAAPGLGWFFLIHVVMAVTVLITVWIAKL